MIAAARLKRVLPFLDWPRVTAGSLRADLIAGVTVSLILIPQSLAYAQLAGIPAQYGLYAAFIPTAVGALFGSSAILSTGPVAMTSLLTMVSVSALVPQGTAQFYAYVTLLALMSGLFQLGFGLARAGVLLSLVSHPVLMGFINAAALIIALSQLPTLTGIAAPQTEHLLQDTWSVVSHGDSLHAMSAAFGVVAMALLVGFRRLAPRLPGVLIVVGLLTWASYATGFAEHGGGVIGSVPSGLPSFALPDLRWSAMNTLLPAAFIVALISFMEAMSSSKLIAHKMRVPWSDNQELIGQGLAKIAAALCQTMPVSGSFSRSALNFASGARTGLSSVIAAAAVLGALLYFTPYLHHLPKPVLAAIILLAVANLIDVRAMRQAWLASREDGIAGTATFVATLVFAPNIQNGILIGIIVSLAAFIYGRMRPRVIIVGLHADGMLRDARRFDLPPLHPQIGALRFDASLYFANASVFEDAVLQLERERPGIKYILVAAQGINQLDASGVEMLRNLCEHLRESGITLVVGGVKKQVQDVMDRTGLARSIGEGNVFVTDRAAIDSMFARIGSTTA
jgi:sulfate permease, SulP family